MAVAQATIPSVQVRFQKKGTLDASKPRSAKIVVEAGKITIVSLENKFPTTINLKAANVEKPKRPIGKTTTWICLDIVQNVDAKFTYVNIQVNNPNEMDEVFKTLMIAWTPKKSDVLNDNGSFSIAAPVHIPPPNRKMPAVSTVGVGSSARTAMSVDPEGSARLSFNNDFKIQPPAQNRRAEMNNTLKGLFNDYGVSNTSKEQPPMQVHSNPVPKPRLFERKQEERENVPVSTKPSAGLTSFYGNSTNSSSISRPTLSNSINRSGTKESLGPSLSRFNRSIVKNDHIDDSSMGQYDQVHRSGRWVHTSRPIICYYDFNANDHNVNREPPKEKITNPSAGIPWLILISLGACIVFCALYYYKITLFS